METIFEVKTDKRLVEVANKLRMPGWYFDINGVLCCIINYNLFTIFINDCTNEIEIAVDALSKDGIFEQNIEWQTLATDTNEALKQIRQVISQYK